MDHRLATVAGRAIYAQRKSTVEPVYGIVKSVLGFRQFHLRGLAAVSGEWTLVTMAWNLKRLFKLSQPPRSAAACPETSKGAPNRSIPAKKVIQMTPKWLELAKTAVSQAVTTVHNATCLALCDFGRLSPTGC